MHSFLPWTGKAEAANELSHDLRDLLIYRSILQDQGRLLRGSSSVFQVVCCPMSYGLVVTRPINKCILKSEEQVSVISAGNSKFNSWKFCVVGNQSGVHLSQRTFYYSWYTCFASLQCCVCIPAYLWHFWNLSILLVSFHLPKWCYHIGSVLDSKCFQLVTALFQVPDLVSLFCTDAPAPGYWNHTWQPGGWRCISRGSGREGSLSVNVLNLQMLSKSEDVMYQQVGKFLVSQLDEGSKTFAVA